MSPSSPPPPRPPPPHPKYENIGELLAEACHLGTAHPPGYPLFTMLSHLSLSSSLSALPRLYIHPSTGDLAVDFSPTSGWKMNHLTALFAASAAVFVALTSYELLMMSVLVSNRRQKSALAFTPAAITALGYAFSPLVWEHSVGAEVFALNNLFCAIIVYLTVKVILGVYTVAAPVLSSPNTSTSTSTPAKLHKPTKTGKMKSTDSSSVAPSTPALSTNVSTSGPSPRHKSVLLFLLLGAFTCGLALSNQHASLLLLVVAVPAVLVATATQDLEVAMLFQLAMAFALGLASYNYLFMASLHPKPGSWGDLGHIRGLLGHVLRTEYGTFSLGMTLGSEGFVERIWIYVLHLVNDTCGYVFLPLALLGLCSVLQEHDVVNRDTLGRLLGHSASKKKAGGHAAALLNKKQKSVPQASKTQKGAHKQKSTTKAKTPSLQEPSASASQTTPSGTEQVSAVIMKESGTGGSALSKPVALDVKPSSAKKGAKTTVEPKQGVAVGSASSVSSQLQGKEGGTTCSAPDTDTSRPTEKHTGTAATSTPKDTGKTSVTKKESQRLVAKEAKEISAPSASPAWIALRGGQYWSVMFLIASLVVYLVVWNGVLSNIPLSAPMPYGVHARFWMQPNIIVFVFMSMGISCVMRLLFQLVAPELKSEPEAELDPDLRLRKEANRSSSSSSNNMSTSLLDMVLQCSLVTVVFVLLMHTRFDGMDRSQNGWVMHEYGNYILQSTASHSNSLLLSHTDLNWNTIRYLQVCEGVKSAEGNLLA